MAELVSSLEKFHVVSLRSRSPPLVKSSRKLPELELPKFSGNPMDWPGFWDQFQYLFTQVVFLVTLMASII